jgi:hypothetical protein
VCQVVPFHFFSHNFYDTGLLEKPAPPASMKTVFDVIVTIELFIVHINNPTMALLFLAIAIFISTKIFIKANI